MTTIKLPVEPKVASITLSVHVSDDSFESRLTFPVDCPKEKINAMFLGWMNALDVAISAQKEIPCQS